MWLAPTAVWCRTWLTASPPWRRWGVVYSETACHHLRGGDFGGVRSLRACRRRPGRRNTRLRTAATSSGVAEMSAFGHLSLLGRDGAFCGSGRPATASGVAILGACSRSGHVADAQVGEIPGFARLPPPPGWRKCPPLVIVIVSASAEVGRTLRCAYGVSLNRVSVRELSGRIAHIQPSLSALHPSVLACIDACASESSV